MFSSKTRKRQKGTYTIAGKTDAETRCQAGFQAGRRRGVRFFFFFCFFPKGPTVLKSWKACEWSSWLLHQEEVGSTTRGPKSPGQSKR